MASTALQDDDAQIETVEFEYADRIFSPEPAEAAKPQRHDIRKLRQRPEDRQLPEFLAETLWDHLPWSKTDRDESERKPLVEAYVRSLSRLDEFRRDVENMVRAACVANLEFRQATGETNAKARDAVLEAKLDEMLEKAACDWRPIRNILDERLVSQHVSTLRSHLEVALAEDVNEFAKQFFELLAKLVERQLIGLVEWLPNHCCGYHFFKSIVIQENEGASSRVLAEKMFTRATRRDRETDRLIIGKRRVAEMRGQGKHFHRFARHEHKVMNAIHTTIRDSRVVMPPQVVRLVEHIPDWLYPHVQVIDGEIFRERIIERDMGVENWADVRIRDEPIIGCEPGVIIGPYVLTGWGPREVKQEQDRRQSVQRVASQKRLEDSAGRRAPWFIGASVALTLVALVFLVQWGRGAGGLFIAGLATVAAMGSVWQAALDVAVARRHPMAAWAAHWLTATVAFQILLAEWLVARWFHPLSWVTPVALGAAAIICHALGRRLW